MHSFIRGSQAGKAVVHSSWALKDSSKNRPQNLPDEDVMVSPELTNSASLTVFDFCNNKCHLIILDPEIRVCLVSKRVKMQKIEKFKNINLNVMI